jgi:hypothetical protein
LDTGRSPDERPRSTHIIDGISLRGIAGTAAIILGALYAYGAVIKAGELHDAGQVVGDTLPLVPLEQILVLGINRILPVCVAILAVLLVAMAFLDRDTPSVDENDDEGEVREGSGRHLVFALRVFTYLIWAWLFLAASWTTWLLIAELTAVGWYASVEHSTGRTYAIFASMALVVFFAVSAYFDPAPLPEVRLTKRNGEVVKGDLIATTGSTWYVAVGDKHWTAVQAREADGVRVSSVKKPQKESLYHAITGHRLFGLGPE